MMTTEVNIMENSHAKADQALDRGICSSCDHALVCHLHRKGGRPVFFCEEFTCVPRVSKHPMANVYSLPGRYEGQLAVKKSEQARPSYIGLCRTCAKLAACPLLKPGGGTWQCDFHEKHSNC
jgi:hypothetical protein